jgi:hypothetical protein
MSSFCIIKKASKVSFFYADERAYAYILIISHNSTIEVINTKQNTSESFESFSS